ncbi:unnamed protein product, partial [Prorocentrum cordatum]
AEQAVREERGGARSRRSPRPRPRSRRPSLRWTPRRSGGTSRPGGSEKTLDARGGWPRRSPRGQGEVEGLGDTWEAGQLEIVRARQALEQQRLEAFKMKADARAALQREKAALADIRQARAAAASRPRGHQGDPEEGPQEPEGALVRLRQEDQRKKSVALQEP